MNDIEIIKAECKKQLKCDNCPMLVADEYLGTCCIFEVLPYDWNTDKIQKIIEEIKCQNTK